MPHGLPRWLGRLATLPGIHAQASAGKWATDLVTLAGKDENAIQAALGSMRLWGMGREQAQYVVCQGEGA
jgi:hypothetical protein